MCFLFPSVCCSMPKEEAQLFAANELYALAVTHMSFITVNFLSVPLCIYHNCSVKSGFSTLVIFFISFLLTVGACLLHKVL